MIYNFQTLQISNLVDRSYLLYPHVSAISPSQGSLAGGTSVTVQGGGFTPETEVTLFNGAPCEEVIFNSYEEIVCVTTSHSSEMVVELNVNVGQIPATCELTNCVFEYLESLTPEVTGVSPSNIQSTGTVITVSGTGFGTNHALLSVEIGGEPCAVDAAGFTDSQFECTLSVGLPYGEHKVVVHKAQEGWAACNPSMACDLNSEAVLASISPSAGSTEGGTTVTLSGNGFTDADGTTVLVDGATCAIDSITASQVTCTTPAHAAGVVSVTVTVEGGNGTVTFDGSVTFDYTSAATPTVTAVVPTSGTGGTTVTISGTLFSSVDAENTVDVGGKCVRNELLVSNPFMGHQLSKFPTHSSERD